MYEGLISDVFIFTRGQNLACVFILSKAYHWQIAK